VKLNQDIINTSLSACGATPFPPSSVLYLSSTEYGAYEYEGETFQMAWFIQMLSYLDPGMARLDSYNGHAMPFLKITY
jgi:hypothetical protein